MILQLLSVADAQETGDVSSHTVSVSEKYDWTPDPYMQTIIGRIATEGSTLLNVFNTDKKLKFTQALKESDKEFDRVFLYSKNLVSAYIYSPDTEVAANAAVVMRKFEVNDPELYRLGYGKQIFTTKSLLADVNDPEVKACTEKLASVPEAFVLLANVNNKLDALYEKSIDNKSSIEELMPTSVQKNIVINIINEELLPYLSSMSKKDSATYEKFAKTIFTHIENVNTNIRARITRKENTVESVEQ